MDTLDFQSSLIYSKNWKSENWKMTEVKYVLKLQQRQCWTNEWILYNRDIYKIEIKGLKVTCHNHRDSTFCFCTFTFPEIAWLLFLNLTYNFMTSHTQLRFSLFDIKLPWIPSYEAVFLSDFLYTILIHGRELAGFILHSVN